MELTVGRRIRTFLLEIPDKSHGLRFSLAVAGAYLTALSAQVAFDIRPITPVPVTLQVFTVLMTAALLGPFYGGVSQLLYVLAGAAGLPWYAGGGVQWGITAGYLAGFVAAGGLVGYMAHHHEFRGERWRLVIAMSVGLVIIYIFGAFHLAMVLKTTYRQTLQAAVLPFVVPDVIKILFAASIAHWVFGTRWAMVPKRRRGL